MLLDLRYTNGLLAICTFKIILVDRCKVQDRHACIVRDLIASWPTIGMVHGLVTLEDNLPIVFFNN